MSADLIEIVDVAARDGLQSEQQVVSTEVKVELLTRLMDAGMRRMEVSSFVNPARVPQMADAEAVFAAIPRRPDVSTIGLVLNERGLERAVAARCDEVNAVVVASDTFCQRNQGCSTAESVERWRAIAAGAVAAGIRPSVVVSAAWGCPFEGEVPVERVAAVCADAVAAGIPDRLSLADTIGVASPRRVKEVIAAVRDVVGDDVPLACHFHNTRSTGSANVAAAIGAGVRSFDASLGGVGGCPFAPGATGNVCTEDLVYMLHRDGFTTGLDLDALAETSRWLATHLGASVVGQYAKAGPFPRPVPV